jgi:hypothetical protein
VDECDTMLTTAQAADTAQAVVMIRLCLSVLGKRVTYAIPFKVSPIFISTS